MFERVLASSKYLVYVTVVMTILAAVALYVAAAMSVVTVIVDAVRAGPWLPTIAKQTAIGFLNVIDLLLIAAGLQMIAIGIYRIFLNRDLPVPSGLQISNFEELKVSLVKLVGIVLIILFLEYAFKLGPGLPILYFGLAIAVVIAAFGWAISQEKKMKS